MFLGACELSNKATNKTSTSKKAVDQIAANSTSATKERKTALGLQYDIDEPKMLAFIKQYKMDATKLNSGLHYVIINKGSGKTPSADSTVEVSYEVSDLNGNLIWTTTQSGGKEMRIVNQFPVGVAEGLQLIQEGGRVQLIIPSALAYGSAGWGEQIGPNTNLYYDIQLNRVE